MSSPWHGLRSSSAVMQGTRVDAQHPREWWWCVDPAGNYGLALYGISKRGLPPDLVELRGLNASIRETQDGAHFLLLLLGNRDEWELFLALCLDVVDSTADTASSEQAFEVATARIRRWQRFLSRGRHPRLTDQEARGLLAELLFLRDELAPRIGLETAANGWSGLDGHPQDFSVDNRLFEVKSRLSSARQNVEISSAEQLDSTSAKFILVVQELSSTQRETIGAVMLVQIVSSLRQLLAKIGQNAAQRFDELLDDYGYEDEQECAKMPLLPLGRRYFHVRNDFPRVVRTRVAPEIVRLRYTLDISQCSRFEVADYWI